MDLMLAWRSVYIEVFLNKVIVACMNDVSEIDGIVVSYIALVRTDLFYSCSFLCRT